MKKKRKARNQHKKHKAVKSTKFNERTENQETKNTVQENNKYNINEHKQVKRHQQQAEAKRHPGSAKEENNGKGRHPVTYHHQKI